MRDLPWPLLSLSSLFFYLSSEHNNILYIYCSLPQYNISSRRAGFWLIHHSIPRTQNYTSYSKQSVSTDKWANDWMKEWVHEWMFFALFLAYKTVIWHLFLANQCCLYDSLHLFYYSHLLGQGMLIWRRSSGDGLAWLVKPLGLRGQKRERWQMHDFPYITGVCAHPLQILTLKSNLQNLEVFRS